MFKALLGSLFELYKNWLQTYGAPAVGVMMALESTIVPLPSELIIPPAAHLAYTDPNSHLSLAGIIIAGTLGSWIGATIMYWVARIAGRPFVLNYGKFFLISPEKVEGAERWAKYYGPGGVFISRLLPVVRHLIGIPAGIVRMNYTMFSLFTILGSGIWCGILCWLGIKIGQEQMKGEYHRIVLLISGAMIVLGAIYYFFVHRQMKKNVGAK